MKMLALAPVVGFTAFSFCAFGVTNPPPEIADFEVLGSGKSVLWNPYPHAETYQILSATNFGGGMTLNERGSLPSCAMITSVQLMLDVIRNPLGGGQASTFGFHRMLRSWGEGDKVPDSGSPGLGQPATMGEATWDAPFAFSTESWGVPGGESGADFVSSASANHLIYGVGDSPYVVSSTTALIADVQTWVDQPLNNFGWLLMG